jgi:cell shape-determining protein MreC
VTDPNFFVGLVTEVYEHSARVTFAIDATQSIGAQLLNSGEVGIAWGMWQRGGRMELRHVERPVQAQEGEYVVTSCATEASTAQVPCGLIIGIVAGPSTVDNQGDTQTIPILPGAKFDELSVVAVIIADTNA